MTSVPWGLGTTLRAGLLTILAIVALTQPAGAQSSLQVPLQFDFINPGAKNLALGGAFVGMADDATATFANPAGLTQLGASEISLEIRSFRVSTPYLQSGRLSGAITNQGIDTVTGPVFANSIGTNTGAGFAAGVYLSPSRRWAVAAHRHELVRINQSFFSTGVFQKSPDEFTSRRDSPTAGDRVLSITGYGASAAYKLRRNLSVGGTLSIYRFTIDSLYRRFDIDGFLGAPVLTRVAQRATQVGSSVSASPTIGVAYGSDQAVGSGSLLRRTRVGVVYRHGPSFSYTTQGEGLPPVTGLRFRVPHTLAVGAALRARPQLLVGVEVARVLYSRMVDDFVADQARAEGRQADFSIDDGTEVHVGAQYAVPQWKGIPRFRAGAWFDPDHSVRFEPQQPSTTAFARVFDERLSTALSQGRNQVHATGGIGLTLHRRLEVNAAVDVSSTQVRASTSFIVR